MDDKTFRKLFKKEIKKKIEEHQQAFPNCKYHFAEINDSGKVEYFDMNDPSYLDQLIKQKRRHYCIPVQQELPFGAENA